MAKWFCRGAVRNSSLARRVGGVDLRAERRPECPFFHANARRLRTLCTRALACSLPALPALLRSGSDVETDAGDGSIRFAAFGLLAAREVRSCKVSGAHGAATTNQQAATNGHSPDNRKDSVLCAVCSFFRGDAARSVPFHRHHRSVAIGIATEQRGCQLCCLHLADVLADTFGGCLSSP